jgi:hypothetical protein
MSAKLSELKAQHTTTAPNDWRQVLRVVGNSHIALPSLMPTAQALEQAVVHQATGLALMRVATSGVRKGVYRYATHEAANRASEEALLVAMAMNLPPFATAK